MQSTTLSLDDYLFAGYILFDGLYAINFYNYISVTVKYAYVRMHTWLVCVRVCVCVYVCAA